MECMPASRGGEAWAWKKARSYFFLQGENHIPSFSQPTPCTLGFCVKVWLEWWISENRDPCCRSGGPQHQHKNTAWLAGTMYIVALTARCGQSGPSGHALLEVACDNLSMPASHGKSELVGDWFRAVMVMCLIFSNSQCASGTHGSSPFHGASMYIAKSKAWTDATEPGALPYLSGNYR